MLLNEKHLCLNLVAGGLDILIGKDRVVIDDSVPSAHMRFAVCVKLLAFGDIEVYWERPS